MRKTIEAIQGITGKGLEIQNIPGLTGQIEGIMDKLLGDESERFIRPRDFRMVFGFYRFLTGSFLYSVGKWPDPLENSMGQDSVFIFKGRDRAGKTTRTIRMEDSLGRGLRFSLKDGEPSVETLFLEDPKSEPLVDPRLVTSEQRLNYGLFLVTRLTDLLEGNPLDA